MKSEWCQCGHHFENHGYIQFRGVGKRPHNSSRTSFNCNWHPKNAEFQFKMIKNGPVLIPYMGYGHWCDCKDFIPLV